MKRPLRDAATSLGIDPSLLEPAEKPDATPPVADAPIAPAPVFDLKTLQDAAAGLGLNPEHFANFDPTPSVPQSDVKQDRIAERLEDAILAWKAFDLSDEELTFVVNHFFILKPSLADRPRFRIVWRCMTYLMQYPGVSFHALPMELVDDYPAFQRVGKVYACTKHYFDDLKFNDMRDRIKVTNPSLAEWSQLRREQLDKICNWETERYQKLCRDRGYRALKRHEESHGRKV